MSRREFKNRKRHKITIINIGKDKIMLGFNDSESVIINLQESISIRDGITVKVVKQIRLSVEKNFTSIKLEDAPFDKYEPEQKGRIEVTAWIVGEDYPVVYYVRGKLRNFSSLQCVIWEDERLGLGSKGDVPDSIKKCIDGITKN